MLICLDSFCERVRREAGVLLLPGPVFEPDSREFRIGIGRVDMPDALARFDAFLRGAAD